MPYASAASIPKPEGWLKDQNDHSQGVLSNSENQCRQRDVIQKKAQLRA